MHVMWSEAHLFEILNGRLPIIKILGDGRKVNRRSEMMPADQLIITLLVTSKYVINLNDCTVFVSKLVERINDS